jgi:hypothetical protein
MKEVMNPDHGARGASVPIVDEEDARCGDDINAFQGPSPSPAPIRFVAARSDTSFLFRSPFLKCPIRLSMRSPIVGISSFAGRLTYCLYRTWCWSWNCDSNAQWFEAGKELKC